MASVDYWAEASMQRQQMALFAPTLDAMINADDPVRLVDEVLARLDWSSWEAEYDGSRGQPPIHPRILAATLLYGLCRGIRRKPAVTGSISCGWWKGGRSITRPLPSFARGSADS
jgi:hypothetical protein